ncbi:MAG: tetratricopeptide repeat protein [Deltaproteobacteria bacterium]|nr:tetratricopeptide repeat protein [Deltaproteobacteria bacterium]
MDILMGEAWLAKGKFIKATLTLAKALQGAAVEGENLRAYYQLGQAYIKASQLDKAKEVLTKVAATKDPFWKKLAEDRLLVAELSAKMTARQGVALP